MGGWRSKVGPRLREIKRDEKRDHVDYILHGWENELMMYIVSRAEKGGRGGIRLGLGVRTLSGRYDPQYKISWSSTYPFVS